MRAKCTATSVPETTDQSIRWPVDLGAEYELFGIGQNDGVWYAVFEHSDSEMPVSAPLALFDIIDGRIPNNCRLTTLNGQVSVQPPELDDRYFLDDVQERRGDALARYREMKARLRS